jgi:hypothetical protein
MKITRRSLFLAVIATALLFPSRVPAQEAESGQAGQSENLAKQLSNPIADLVSIPFQFNWENGVGENNDIKSVLYVQPVIPFSISKSTNMILRFILPFASQPAGIAPGSEPVSGTGDIAMSLFFSPKKSKLIWGVGPIFGLPTSTDPRLGSGKWSAGPTVVVLKQLGGWTIGGLANHLWSYADTGDIERSSVSTSFVQPFAAYTTKKAVTFTLQTESTYNWEAEAGQRWTVPLNFLVSKVTRLGPFPFSVQGGGGYYVESPQGGPDWRLRIGFTLILPRGK